MIDNWQLKKCATCLSIGDTVDYLLTGVWFGLFVIWTASSSSSSTALSQSTASSSGGFRIAVMALLSVFAGLVIVSIYSWNLNDAIYYCHAQSSDDYNNNMKCNQFSMQLLYSLNNLNLQLVRHFISDRPMEEDIGHCVHHPRLIDRLGQRNSCCQIIFSLHSTANCQSSITIVLTQVIRHIYTGDDFNRNSSWKWIELLLK